MKTKGGRWPVGLAAVLAITVAANGFVLFRAAQGGGMPIEHDAYRKAVLWDSTMAQSARNRTLGWHLAVTLDTEGLLVAELTDRAGASVVGADVSVEGFAVAFTDGEFSARLQSDGDRRFRGPVGIKHGGLHELRFVVVRGADRFTAVLRGVPGAGWRAP